MTNYGFFSSLLKLRSYGKAITSITF
jgi:hypothetical protein